MKLNMFWIGAGIAGIFLLFYVSGLKQDRTHVLNLRGSGFYMVSGALLTEGSSGDVYLWVEQNGKIMCPRKTYIRSGMEQRFEFRCAEMSMMSNFWVRTNRNPSDWVRKNATSL